MFVDIYIFIRLINYVIYAYHLLCVQLCLVVQSVEVILENEGSQSTRGYPVLAYNVTAIVKVLEWTGDVSVL